MKKAVKIFVLVITIIFLTAILLFGTAFVFKPFGNVFFSFCFGSRYVCNGEAVLFCDGRKTVLPVYKAAGKPFLLVGPYCFGDYEDFFFVNKKQLVTTAVDKGGDAWFQIGKYLFVLDDLSHWDVLRMPWHDFMVDPASRSDYDPSTHNRVYLFKFGKIHAVARLELAEKLFTGDMVDSCNATIEKIPVTIK